MKPVISSFSVDKTILGNLYINGSKVLVDEITDFEAEVSSQLKQACGFFALYIESDTHVHIVVDRVRSIPLFYAHTEQAFYVSDNFSWISEQLPRAQNCRAHSEFLLTGYVCGADTLHPMIKQVEAGQWVKFCKASGALQVTDHFLFDHHEPNEIDAEELANQFYKNVTICFERLVKHANGRQIVLPLSGGFDSRLIASSLKQLGYQNVVCFSYGVKGNKEATLSKKIADSLGYNWHFIEYTDELWQKAWFSEQAKQFQIMASQGVSLPHIQDWLAIKILKEKQFVTNDAIFVPGHSGDFVAGSHIPDITFEKERFSSQELVAEIAKNHYGCAPRMSNNAYSDNSVLAERIKATLPVEFAADSITFANAYESWDWRERQAKYIINSVRAYEFFGYEWWLPLWEHEFVSFWCGVPLQLRKNRLWYNGLVAQLFKKQAPSFEELSSKNAADYSAKRKLAHHVYGLLPVTMKKIIYAKKLRRDFDTHFLNFGALLSQPQKEEFAKYGFTIIGAYNQLFLEKRWGGSDS
jgi:asparagine synthase (glutamine-hydrolysing)